jgi:hypothetical protein
MWVQHSSVTGNQYYVDCRNGTGTAYIYKPTGSAISVPGSHTLYINGVAVASGVFTPVAGVWYHLVVVAPTAADTTLTISAGSSYFLGQVGMFATYPTALTANQIASLYDGYFKLPLATADDTNPIVITEDSPEYILYRYDWTTSGAA